MRRAFPVMCLGTLSLALLSGCTSSRSLWEEWFPPKVNSLYGNVALERALRLCSLHESTHPFHLLLQISPPPHQPEKFAQIEIFWLNPITYRTVIRSKGFTQTRIVNGRVVDERNAGDYYPRWIQNFVDALLDPVPVASHTRKISGTVPIGPQTQACVSNIPRGQSEDGASRPIDVETDLLQACFAGPEPKLTSAMDPTRYISYDDFQPFGSQLIARSLVASLPENTLIRAHIVILEPLSDADQHHLKATEFTQASKQITTTLVPGATALALLDRTPSPKASSTKSQPPPPPADPQHTDPVQVYIRTDRTGRVREAYPDNSDHLRLQGSTIQQLANQALSLKFKPYVVNGAPQQMEATIHLLPGMR